MSGKETNDNNGHTQVEVTSHLPDSKHAEMEPKDDYDDILTQIGEFGLFQLMVVIFVCLASMAEAGSVMYYSFAGNVPDHRCIVPACDNGSSIYNEVPTWLNYTVPWEDGKPSSCQVYNSSLEYDFGICSSESIPPSSVSVSCQNFLYDKSLFQSTIVTTFDLVCDESWKAASIESCYMAGMLIGAFAFGSLADKVGRRLSMVLISAFMALATIGGTFLPNFVSFAISRLCAGAGGAGLFAIGLVIATAVITKTLFHNKRLEAVGPKYRTATNFVFQASSTMGAILTGVVAYYVRDWQNLQLIISLPYAFFLLYWWLIPESVRWLISKNRNEEAKAVIARIARINRKPVPENLSFLDEKQGQSKNSTSESNQNLPDNIVTCEAAPSQTKIDGTLWDVLKNFALLKRLLIMVYAWIVIVMCYYGLSIGSTNLSDEYFLNYWLSMIVELPSYLLGIWGFEKLGRKPTLAGSLLLGGIACILVGFVSNPEALTITLSLIGKFFVSLAFGVVYGYTVEIFPTAARGAALGVCSTFSRLGSIAAPYLVLLDSALPYLIFGVTGISAGIFAFFLPETLGKHLPQNLQEALDLDKDNTGLFICCRKKPERNETQVQQN